ncbi:hypothetical protein HID58_017202 [Brassica napus]|uniref:Uncharacterized protein n=1 Tax=Brassica napus TaxID=3708 RepID=A0ABQ8D6E8_BRANA|nr:hypothetical protein HID58_017202 [Brassica napus]
MILERERRDGKERREEEGEKKYLAAHGGPARLPPPPDRSKQDLLPSKLRVPHDSTKQVVEKKENNSKGSRVDAAAKNGSDIKSEERNDDGYTTSCDQENDELAELDGRSKRKERKKKYWEVKKQKKNQGKKEDTLRENFPKHEEIRFGDVVQAAPPKLAIVPKARKTPMSASKERLRLEAIKAYRSRNRWTHGPQDQVFRFLQWQCTKMRHELSFVVRVCPWDCMEMESSFYMKRKHPLVTHVALLISHFEAKEVKKRH